MRTLSSMQRATVPKAGERGRAPPSRERIAEYVAAVRQSESAERRLSGARSLRELLSQQRDPPSAQVMASGVVPRIVELLAPSAAGPGSVGHAVQFEAAWIVTNLASGTAEATALVVEHGAIERLVAMFRAFGGVGGGGAVDAESADMALWGLGNIGGENQAMCARVLRSGLLDDLAESLPAMGPELKGNAAWTVSNIVRNAERLTPRQTAALLPALRQLLRDSGDGDGDGGVLRSALWAVTYLSARSDALCHALQSEGVVDAVMRVLALESAKYEKVLRLETAKARKREQNMRFAPSAQRGVSPLPQQGAVMAAMKAMDHFLCKPALRFLGNILSGPDELTQCVLDAGYLDVILPFVNHFSVTQRKEMIWSLSNILAGSHQQIEAVLSREELLRSVIRAATSDNQCVKREATWCLGNATVDAVPSQILKLADFGAIEALCKMLNPVYEITNEHTMIIVEALDAFLRVYGPSAFNPHADIVEECSGLDFLEDRQGDAKLSGEVYDAICSLIQKYWGHDDGLAQQHALCDPIAAEIDDETNQFKFGCGGDSAAAAAAAAAAVGQHHGRNVALYQF